MIPNQFREKLIVISYLNFEGNESRLLGVYWRKWACVISDIRNAELGSASLSGMDIVDVVSRRLKIMQDTVRHFSWLA